MSEKLTKCPKCGSEQGLYANGTFLQFYDWDGEPSGFVHNSTSKTVYCIHCSYKTDLRRLQKKSEEVK